MSKQTMPSARPSGAGRRTTIGQLMMIVAIVAFYAWLFRALMLREPSLLHLLAILIILAFFGVPSSLQRRYWHGDDPRYEPINPCSDPVPSQVARNIAETVPRMEALGFRSLGHFRNAGSVPNVTEYLSLFEKPASRCTAQAITSVQEVGRMEDWAILAFLTEFTDGTCLITENSWHSIIYPPPFFRRGSMSFPRITEPRRLYEIHEASVAHYAAECIPSRPYIPDPSEYLRSDQGRMLARIAEAGYFRHDEARQVYRLTWKGAILLTWKHTWPIRPIGRMLRRLQADRMLRELGLESLAHEATDGTSGGPSGVGRGFQPDSVGSDPTGSGWKA